MVLNMHVYYIMLCQPEGREPWLSDRQQTVKFICPLLITTFAKPHVTSRIYSRMECGYVTLKSHLFLAHSQGEGSFAHTQTHRGT